VIILAGQASNAELLQEYEDACNAEYPDGSYRSLLARIRQAMDAKMEYGLQDMTGRSFDLVFTDVEVANYIMKFKHIKDSQLYYHYYILYKRRVFNVFGSIGMVPALKSNVHKRIEFKVVDNTTKGCCVIL
jgi:hypothetical protein